MGMLPHNGDRDRYARMAMKNGRGTRQVEIAELRAQIAALEDRQTALTREVGEYRNIIDNMVEGMFRITLEGDVLNINSAGAAILGYDSREDFFAHVKKAEDIWGVPQDRAQVHELIKETGFLKEFVMQGRCKNGEARWVTVNVRLARNKDGDILYNEGTFQDIHERKQLEDQLTESKKLARTLLDLPLNNIIVLMGIDGTILDCNQAVADRLALSIPEIIGKSLFDFLPPDAVKRRKEKIREMIQTKKPIRMEDMVLGCWYDSTAYPIPDENGNITKIAAFSYDITSRIEAQERLKGSEARFRSYFELPLVGIVIATPEKNFIEANDRACEILGYPREELLRARWDRLTHPDDLSRDLANVERVVRGELPHYSSEKRYRRKDGTYIWAIVSVAAVRKPDGDVDYMVAIIQDIDERKKMEEELIMHRDHLGKLVAERTEEMNREMMRRKEKEEQYQSLVESIVEWVWETDEHFVITYNSPRVSEYLGYEPEFFLGKTPYDFMLPDRVPEVRKYISRRKPFVSMQMPHTDKNGNSVLIEGSGTPYFDRDGLFRGYRGSCRDITEQKRTMDKLQEREKQLMAQSETLKETNAALRVLLKQREDDKREMEDMFISNIKEMVLPYVHKMRKEKIEMRHRAYLDIINTNLNEIMAPFLNRIRQLNFTPKEIEVASLIRDGKTTKEIAEIMGVATSAIDSHRNNIRTKLGLIKKDVNLRSYLMTFK